MLLDDRSHRRWQMPAAGYNRSIRGRRPRSASPRSFQGTASASESSVSRFEKRSILGRHMFPLHSFCGINPFLYRLVFGSLKW